MYEQRQRLKLLAEIDVELNSARNHLRFGPPLEQRFRAETDPKRRQGLITMCLIGLFLFDLLLVNDWVFIPDIFPWDAIFRLAVFTPIGLVTIFLLRTGLSLRLIEAALTCLVILCMLQGVLIYDVSHSPYRQAYHYAAILMMMFTVSVLRLGFGHVIATLVGMIALQSAGALLVRPFDPKIIESDCLFFGVVSIFILIIAGGLERQRRRSYLFSVRNRLNHARLDHLSKTDPLTGLFNRRHLTMAMEQIWVDAAGIVIPVAVILIDIDHFKLFNDKNGHVAGDACLARVGACIYAVSRDNDGIAVRFGGEEFLVLLAGETARHVGRIADRVQAAIRDEAIPSHLTDADRIVTGSIGFAYDVAPVIGASELISRADAALYRAKQAGRDCILSDGPV